MISDFDLVIFDLDGVLIDSEILSCGCLAEMLTRHGIAMSTADVIERYLGRSFAIVRDDFQRQTGQPMSAAFVDALRAEMFRRYRAELRAIEGAGALLQSMRRPYCLASSSDAERIDISLGLTGFSAFFEGRIFNAAMVARGKPAPDLFLKASAEMGVAPARTLVIEDSVSGVTAGKAAGMTVWGFVGGSHYGGRDGHGLLSSAGADRVVATMAAMLPQPVAEIDA
ncbi:HAD family hydrolase [Kaistia dalseonensis]|uniref:HAD superfamily hydrolase (TIGR01509 family) n=1 Tax=Kaistia dalseonensis TaxID=410840 RepID=A0ABU0HCX7_9HYPH|nr:HAD family hydrolase [Kaistia dalseonensis]MCX5496723.1 HAD family hydrolase [Kaistia dalseonensis]MDQ0439349.1 HAD superfamily hydrolase (TIGR01509 family) [Kaistia dalseonensis]